MQAQAALSGNVTTFITLAGLAAANAGLTGSITDLVGAVLSTQMSADAELSCSITTNPIVTTGGGGFGALNMNPTTWMKEHQQPVGAELSCGVSCESALTGNITAFVNHNKRRRTEEELALMMAITA